MTTIGHNSGAGQQLKSLVERIERMEDEKALIVEDIKGIYAEAKANGFDTKVLRKLIALRKQSAVERAEFEAVLHMYMHALGMTAGEAAEASGMMD